jgi:hypothetical protein
MNKVNIFDNALSKNIFCNLQNTIFSDGFPWFYSGTTLGNSTAKQDLFNFSFFHNAYYHDTGYSFIGEKIEIVLESFLHSINEEYNKFLRIRLGLIPCTHGSITHLPHIDFPYPHKTGLLYLNSTDGDTVIYEDRYDTNIEKKNFDNFVRSKEHKILQKVTTYENRIAIFDGLHYHSSSSPTNSDRRIVITFNYT